MSHIQPRIGHITFNAKFLDRRLEVPSDEGIMRRALFFGQRHRYALDGS